MKQEKKERRKRAREEARTRNCARTKAEEQQEGSAPAQFSQHRGRWEWGIFWADFSVEIRMGVLGSPSQGRRWHPELWAGTKWGQRLGLVILEGLSSLSSPGILGF